MAASSVEPQPSLPLEDYRRYGRQMILDGFGLEGQIKLSQASVVVVGAGGLGCPALQYLAAAGVGSIGIIDHDTVEFSNLQRQVLHTESRVGMPKVLSAAEAVKQLNSSVKVNAITSALSALNAIELLAPYDLILDCTDNLPTRYLLSDTAVRLGKPLVSGAAQKFEGQLAVYNLPLKGDVGGGELNDTPAVERGPCFRCLFPKPPAPEMAGSCEELGILGAVTGVIGTLQALEAIKIITGLHDGRPSLLMYSALSMPPFRSVKLRSGRATCPACGVEGEKVDKIEDTDYVAFCGGERPDWVSKGLAEGKPDSRVRAQELKRILENRASSVRVLDVRPRTEFGICHLPGSMNIPLKELLANPSQWDKESMVDDREVYIVCRLGNDSQLAVDAFRNVGQEGVVKDLVGGLRAWAKEVDRNFPIY
ncbi:hypothetical protein DICSQDRAFT_150395 [Dichomitus squalens LYAD-421 SS1]|uniref:Needs CLA4 to survive protein 3 n=1 Tax=Dichomitus squalens (strain LYAD-421) TaxID=732165 RepID=R7SNB7_DICSQ|nr:uncharacterized protein DICSQDRAFT_150395 [Dichomitus squalens LYAD-421 SS1]EJF56497.1 hypothetical protein DICSQDRAFT_150395 [Dichomitus squalens LYAD-421 SS1]